MAHSIIAPEAGELSAAAAPPVAATGHAHAGFWALTLGSLGVVYGDIGTSPLYALRAAVVAAIGANGVVTRDPVLGVLSLILWSLILVVTLKYVLLLLRADNNGEGGTLALMALAQRVTGRMRSVVVLLGIVGAALFFGDALITPAISVLSAIEGLKIVTPTFDPYVVPLTVVILVVLFAVQSRGTARVAAFFGPITTVWFVAMVIGSRLHRGGPQHPGCFQSLLRRQFPFRSRVVGLVTLGAVFLAVTGAEALYADLGHFGRKPIQSAWLGLVLPSLAINYLGQGALVLADPKAIENPFYLLYPHWAQLPMVLLATAATVIASQAVITGAYSLTRQAIQLGLLPRLEIRHTSEAREGQIYVPRVNAALLAGVLMLVAQFRSADALASAYGISVTGTMVVTAMMAFVVVWKLWRWSPLAAAALVAPFVFVDTTFLAANLLKVVEGGWVPLALGGMVMLIMYTWLRGSRLLFEKTRRQETPLDELVAMLEKKPPQRVPGTAVFLTSDPYSAPTALMHSLKHYKVLHQHNVILSIETAGTARDTEARHVRPSADVLTGGASIWIHGNPNVPRALAIAARLAVRHHVDVVLLIRIR